LKSNFHNYNELFDKGVYGISNNIERKREEGRRKIKGKRIYWWKLIIAS
jgi:hypothetical protein